MQTSVNNWILYKFCVFYFRNMRLCKKNDNFIGSDFILLPFYSLSTCICCNIALSILNK